MIRILLVDDQKSIRERLKSLLETEPDFDIVGMVDNGYDAIEQVKLLLPDVVLMDVEMPDIDGVLATKIIARSSPKTKVLVLSSHDGDEYVAQSIYAGAKGYLLKGAPAEEIREAVRFIHRGYMQIAPGLFEKFIPNIPEAGLFGKPKGILASQAQNSDGVELTELKAKASNTKTMVSDRDFDQPSELILHHTAFQPPRKSIWWYQAIASIVVVLGLAGGVYLFREVLSKPADTPVHRDRL